jgi:1,4-alpha-glucan branching enzyme
MITKDYTPKRTVCKVTFALPADKAASSVSLVGDFNEWDTNANKLVLKNGQWSTTVRMVPGDESRFRYFIDGQLWENDDQADGYVANDFGTQDSIVKID